MFIIAVIVAFFIGATCAQDQLANDAEIKSILKDEEFEDINIGDADFPVEGSGSDYVNPPEDKVGNAGYMTVVPGESCFRPCRNSAPRVCHFRWTIENYHVLGP